MKIFLAPAPSMHNFIDKIMPTNYGLFHSFVKSPACPTVNIHLTNRAGIRLKMSLNDILTQKKNQFQKQPIISLKKWYFFQFSKMKLPYNAATLPLFSNLRHFRQIYTRLLSFFWAVYQCIFVTLILQWRKNDSGCFLTFFLVYIVGYFKVVLYFFLTILTFFFA